MNILLVQPKSSKEVSKEFISLQFPINLGYIASVLKKHNNVKMIDLNVQDIELDFCFSDCDLVGVTATTSNIFLAKEVIDKAKSKKVITVLGGVHASALPIETMNEIKTLDYLVYGEGEETIVELVKTLSNNNGVDEIKGLVYRDVVTSLIVKNEPRELINDLDSIPFPSRDLIPFELYKSHHVSRGFSRENINIMELVTSRGCPNNCIFCAGHINYGRRVRFRSYENIVSEIRFCINKYNITHVSIEDDTFTLNKPLVTKMCNFFKSRNLTWNCNTRVDTVDYDLIKMMVDSGCKKVSFGIESGSEDILKKIKKGITLKQIIDATDSAKKAKIKYLECNFIIGVHPDETKEDIELTIKLIYYIMPDFLAVSIMCPYPGTEVYNLMEEKGFLKKDWSQFSYFGDLNRYDRITNFTSKELAEIQKRILKDYYSSPSYIFKQLFKISSFNELKYFAKMGGLFFKEIFIK